MLEQTYAYYPGTQALVDQRAMNDPFPTRIPGRVQKRSQQASGPILLLDSGRVKLANRVEACPATTGSTRDAQRSPAGRPAGRPVGGGPVGRRTYSSVHATMSSADTQRRRTLTALFFVEEKEKKVVRHVGAIQTLLQSSGERRG